MSVGVDDIELSGPIIRLTMAVSYIDLFTLDMKWNLDLSTIHVRIVIRPRMRGSRPDAQCHGWVPTPSNVHVCVFVSLLKGEGLCP